MYNLYAFADLFFLVQWIEERDTIYDVIQAKNTVPPDDLDILDVKPGVMCQTSYEGRFYKVKIFACGKWSVSSTIQLVRLGGGGGGKGNRK